ncbi:hypothetical protein [Levilactobacillus enshiensis]|uniref:hypothetical protein n=1 Tax=Levilactobacillus enshiensis TaxID=2590213 RepID=UPI001179C055|nr:hypothetical protein [Levilactobacillus enshiensis]
MQTTKRHLIIEGILNGILLVFPIILFTIGGIGMAEHNPSHPNALILGGNLLMGVLSLVMLTVYTFSWHRHGWHRLPFFRRSLIIFYGLWLIIGLWTWLKFLSILV